MMSSVSDDLSVLTILIRRRISDWYDVVSQEDGTVLVELLLLFQNSGEGRPILRTGAPTLLHQLKSTELKKKKLNPSPCY